MMASLPDFPADDFEAPDEPWFSEPRDKLPESEFKRQRAVVSHIRKHAPGCFVVAVPNGSKDSDWTALRKHGEGVVAGMTDLIILWNHGALFAEMKGGQTPVDKRQRAVLNRLHRLGFRCGVYRTKETLLAHLREAGAPV